MDRKRCFCWWVGLLLVVAPCVSASTALPEGEGTDSLTVTKKRRTFGERLLQPFKWVARNWSAYDPRYSVPSFYDWAVQVQNTSSMEWMELQDAGIDVRMRSRMSNRFGPYFGYRWIFYGFTIDLNTIGKPKSKNKNEFTLSINSNLLHLDLIRRRTGGDFVFDRLRFADDNGQTHDFTDLTDLYEVGDLVKNSITGFNLNVFTNHKKYSNPAAFSNGAIQLRSSGSPIVGLGYTRQRTESDISSLVSTYALSNGFVNAMLSESYMEEDAEELVRLVDEAEGGSEASEDLLRQLVVGMLDLSWPYLQGEGEDSRIMRSLLTTRFPTTTTIDDWHLQLGYAYNWAISRRLLLGLSAVASPGLKRLRVDNEQSVASQLADDLSRIIRKHEGTYIEPDAFRYRYDGTSFSLNLSARASLTFNYNRWRAGVLATYNRFLYRRNGTTLDNSYGNFCAYVGYCFGRQKDYRYNGRYREEYIRAALTKRQIEEMKDTMPKSNLKGLAAPAVPTAQGKQAAKEGRKTRKYHPDVFNIDVFGCDLVAGPDGRYGWFEVEDGYVTEGQDSEGRLSVGKVLEIDKTGRFHCEAGHRKSFRAGNWWKSQLSIDQTPNHWYPEMLHYALRGKLTLYLRGRVFGTKKPVKLVLEDVCINHGKETKNFFQMGIRSFRSNSAYSIEGRVEINGKPCRIYIEQKRSGRLTNLYVSRLYAANANWMAGLDGQRRLGSISMPGTHDAGSSTVPEQPAALFRAAHTQNFSAASQPYDGIRAFDIRLKRDLKYGHVLTCREGFDSTMVEWNRFLTEHPTECLVALVGSDEGGKWDEDMQRAFRRLVKKYPHRFVEHFSARTPLDSVRGKILVIRRQEGCPFGRLLKFTNNAVFEFDGFCVEDVYKEHKTYKKVKIVERHLRDAYENDDPDKWYITFNSIAWSPRRHNPYSYAWGGRAKNIRKPMNANLREFIDLKDYTDFGIVFLDFYNDHGDNPQIVETIIDSNFHRDEE